VPINADTVNELWLLAQALGLPYRFVAAWAIAEQGRRVVTDGPPASHDWMNIQPNGHEAAYTTLPEYIEAMRALLTGAAGAIDLRLEQLQRADSDFARCILVCRSNWAASNYYATSDRPGGLIWDVYNSPAYAELFAAQPTAEGAVAVLAEALAEPAADVVAAVTGAPAPASAGTAPAEPAVATYTVRPGDTLWRICHGDWTLINAVKALNGIGPDNVIYIGQVLTLPPGMEGA
jgi:hypothetical protein